ncbi:carboxylating nicotinate-nucleotide diphosphorylase [Jeotgalibacillus campisalis]|uniref:Probable nicotinate-nucleotide pyrophosphorylase [carboxylating] n=1 Tax=Jeotgalibacillus campisalis TaxID=220754 RepID=A0A0C2VDH6_9BACL|nr:carboxylating nicotinate-nucleotide diphosphorylase [Jeotgalibacillus campisalis]KIL46987.1 nicotinate-nucleotide pyrophosphorylase [Jeotgalibacillus campisalis]
MNKMKARKMVEQFLYEDIHDQDQTSEALFTKLDQGEAYFILKDSGVLAGLDLIELVYQLLDPATKVELHKQDGQYVEKGSCIASVKGPVQAILSGERVILNLLQRMSGIATLTNEAVKELNSSHTKICDTRKTTPGLRMFEKYAVRCGGGINHRFGLYDGIMLKDNHIAFAGSVREAVKKAKAHAGHMIKIEVEIENEEQLQEAIETKADCIMFDNCPPDLIKKWIHQVPAGILTEASGGITMGQLHKYGNCGVDYISLGFLTHSVKSLDISLDVRIKKGGTRDARLTDRHAARL